MKARLIAVYCPETSLILLKSATTLKQKRTERISFKPLVICIERFKKKLFTSNDIKEGLLYGERERVNWNHIVWHGRLSFQRGMATAVHHSRLLSLMSRPQPSPQNNTLAFQATLQGLSGYILFTEFEESTARKQLGGEWALWRVCVCVWGGVILELYLHINTGGRSMGGLGCAQAHPDWQAGQPQSYTWK